MGFTADLEDSYLSQYPLIVLYRFAEGPVVDYMTATLTKKMDRNA